MPTLKLYDQRLVSSTILKFKEKCNEISVRLTVIQGSDRVWYEPTVGAYYSTSPGYVPPYEIVL